MPTDEASREAAFKEFERLTQVKHRELAWMLLEGNQWNVQAAVSAYYDDYYDPELEKETEAEAEAEDEEEEDDDDDDDEETVPLPIPADRTGAAATPVVKKQAASKFATLSDLRPNQPSSNAGPGNDHDDDDSDGNQDFFAGGEKSGLAVQNPDELKRKIIEKAKRNHSRLGGEDPEPQSSHFTGVARTLGGDDTPSQIIDDPNASKPRPSPPVKRVLHLWHDGFSVDDGPLHHHDDPVNSALLEQITRGVAPLSLLNVERNQAVDVELCRNQGKYVAPKKKYVPFARGGQRLGSPTPGAAIDLRSTGAPSVPSTNSNPSTQSGGAISPVVVNESEPTVSIQIRLGDGTRLASRFNTTHTIGDIYSFVAASSSSSQGRDWVLMTTFPSKELSDKAQVLGDLGEFKRGGVVVQKWR